MRTITITMILAAMLAAGCDEEDERPVVCTRGTEERGIPLYDACNPWPDINTITLADVCDQGFCVPEGYCAEYCWEDDDCWEGVCFFNEGASLGTCKKPCTPGDFGDLFFVLDLYQQSCINGYWGYDYQSVCGG